MTLLGLGRGGRAVDIVSAVDQHITSEPYYLPTAAPSPQAGESGDHSGGWEYFTPSDSVISVWAPDIQHGGPPTGLLTRTLRHTAAANSPQPAEFSRISTDILGPIGLGTNRVRGEVLRPGRQISLIGAELQVQRADGSYRTTATARAWQLHGSPSAGIAHAPRPPMSPLPADLRTHRGVMANSAQGVDWGTTGFIGSTETAGVPGRVGSLDAVWIRPLAALVANEATDFLDSLSVVADVANGVGTALDPRIWTWMNTDTTLHLLRRPIGPWIAIDAELCPGPNGFGATFADLYDEAGFIGRTAQTVLLSSR